MKHLVLTLIIISFFSCKPSENLNLDQTIAILCNEMSVLDLSRPNQPGKLSAEMLQVSIMIETVENHLPKLEKELLAQYNIESIENLNLVKFVSDLIPSISECTKLTQKQLEQGLVEYKKYESL